MSNILYVDIETIPNDIILAESLGDKDKQALCPLTGKIALIGFAEEDSNVVVFDDKPSEETMLRSFWEIVWQKMKLGDLHIVGHNIASFDGPFLVRRAWKYGIKVPNVLVSDLQAYRTQRWIDTMKMWNFYGKGEYVSLEKLCSYFGISVKTSEVKGKDFYKWWAKDKLKCIEYCTEDVTATRLAYQKLVSL